MRIDIQWHDQAKSIIYIHYSGIWTWEEYYKTAEISKQWVREAHPKRVDIIAHMTGSFIPRGNSEAHGESVIKNPEPNLGYVVIVTKSYLINVLTGISFKVSKSIRETYRTAQSVEDAEKLIIEARRKAAANAPDPMIVS